MSNAGAQVLYVVLRRDLLTALNWPLGAVIAQASHAVSAVLHSFHADPNVEAYHADLPHMRKVVLEVPDQAAVVSLAEELKKNDIDHFAWTEQPENLVTCIAVKPYPRRPYTLS